MAAGALSYGSGGSILGQFGAGATIGVFLSVQPFFDTILYAVMTVGVILAYVIPMLPFMIWFFAVLTCAGLAMELVIAAPVAAFFHIRFDGQELIDGPQRAIYGIMFNAILRPPLLLFGLIAANILLTVSIRRRPPAHVGIFRR